MSPRRAHRERDMPPSPFATILEELVARMPGAFAAVLVDAEGECVDYGGRGDPFDLRLAAAHWHIALAEVARHLARFAELGRTSSLLVRAERRSFYAKALADGYAVVVLLGRRAGFGASRRAVDLCERSLCAEAGWPIPAGPHWYPARVDCRGKKPVRICADVATSAHVARPSRRVSPVRGGSAPRLLDVVVLGVIVADPRERGYRIRLDSGLEIMLVREAGGFWYPDEPVPTVVVRAPPRHPLS
jgi:hypothetical protein